MELEDGSMEGRLMELLGNVGEYPAELQAWRDQISTPTSPLRIVATLCTMVASISQRL